MKDDPHRTTTLLSRACVATAAIALAALVGKLLGVRLLASGLTSSIPMAPSTSYAFLFLAAALHPGLPWSRRTRLGLLLPVFVLPIPALATLAAMYRNGGWGAFANVGAFDPWDHVWVMSPLTAGLFFVLGASAASGLGHGRGAAPRGAAWGASVSAAIAFIVLVGYVYGVPLFYGGRVIPMAATTAVCFLVFSAALLAEAGRSFWPWSLLQGSAPKARMMRSFLPLFAVFILVHGLVDSRLGGSGSPLATGVILLVSMPLMAWLVARVSVSLGDAIETAELRLAESERLNRSLVSHLPQRIFVKDLDSRYLFCNANYARDLGIDPARIAGKDDLEFFPAKLAEGYRADDREVMTGGRSKDIEERYMKAGEEWWIHTVKVPYRDEQDKIVGVLGMFEDITARKLAEGELERFKTAIEQSGEAIVITDPGGVIVYANPSVAASTGYATGEVIGKNPRIFKSGKHDEAFYREMWGTIAAGRTWRGRLINRRKDGSLVYKESTISPVRDDGGKIVNYVSINSDITETIRLEETLRQSQKMESVGRLAGGIAHDFNNILTAINGYSRFALAGLAEGDQRRTDLEEVLSASARAARLTSQLLAFSRKQILDPRILDINAAVGGIVSMLERLIGENIRLETRLAAQPCLAKVDAGQMEQVFLNLAVNARDAMPDGGTVVFETGMTTPSDDFYTRHPDMPREPLLCLSVSDTGCGMTDEVKGHLFEPFFTTKEVGKGTGLGLSMVYGIVKQSGGEIEVESAPGRGTTFRIYLTRMNAPPQEEARKVRGAVVRGNETVLLVEDEGMVGRLVARVLTSNGYSVLLAANGPAALEVLSRRGGPVDLLITDVVMPGMNGRELARAFAEKNLAHRTLFVSGYTDDAILQHGVLEPGLAFLSKPFTPDELLRKLREVLGGPARPARAHPHAPPPGAPPPGRPGAGPPGAWARNKPGLSRREAGPRILRMTFHGGIMSYALTMRIAVLVAVAARLLHA